MSLNTQQQSNQDTQLNLDELYTNKPVLFVSIDYDKRTKYYINIDDDALCKLNRIAAYFVHCENPELEDRIRNQDIGFTDLIKKVNAYICKCHIFEPDSSKMPPIGINSKVLEEQLKE